MGREAGLRSRAKTGRRARGDGRRRRRRRRRAGGACFFGQRHASSFPIHGSSKCTSDDTYKHAPRRSGLFDRLDFAPFFVRRRHERSCLDSRDPKPPETRKDNRGSQYCHPIAVTAISRTSPVDGPRRRRRSRPMGDGGSGANAAGDGAAPPPPPSAQTPSCLACRQHPTAYRCWPCGCAALCAACARKMGTGGKCKACKQLFAELRRV